MYEWGWVGLAFGVAYGGVLLYAFSLSRRLRATRRRLDQEG